MKELGDVINAYKALALQGKQAALATVVSVDGSSYRRPGARMLIGPAGPVAGSVSGGCLEADVVEHGYAVLRTGQTKQLVYDTRSDDDALFGLGAGCRGEIKILVERISADHPDALMLPGKMIGVREPAVLAQVYQADDQSLVGKRCLIQADGSYEGCAISSRILDFAGNVLNSCSSETQQIKVNNGTAEVFLEYLMPPIKLIICGAGPDSVPLVRLATELGWTLELIDHRPQLLGNPRFGQAHRVHVSGSSEYCEARSCDPGTAVVVMTHDYFRDLDYLGLFCRSNARYLGLLGSRERSSRLLAALREMNEGPIAAVRAPVGLNIGASTPEEIALSIVAEIQAEFAAFPPKHRSTEPSSASTARDVDFSSRDSIFCRA